MRRVSDRPARSLAATIVACALVQIYPIAVLADVGQPAPAAFSAVTGRVMWERVTPRVADPEDGSTVRVATWERDVSPEEKRYVISEQVAATDNGGSSIEESYERSTRKNNYVASPTSLGDLGGAVSLASLRDFEHAKPIAIVTNGPLELVQKFFRGKRWAYVVSTSTPTPTGMRNVSWTQFPLGALAQRIAGAKACASTGECGE